MFTRFSVLIGLYPSITWIVIILTVCILPIHLLVINGGYTSWSVWSDCSVTCGGGFRTRSRNCTNPEPLGGGKNCDDIGPAEEQEDCNLPECEQCRFFVFKFIGLINPR